MTTAFGVKAGTPVTWKASGGDKVLTVTSKTNNTAQQGDKSASFADANGNLPEYIDFRIERQAGAAVTNGNYSEFYIGESDSATAGTANPGGLGGTDASLSNYDEVKLQLNYLGTFNWSNALGTNQQSQSFRYYPSKPCLIPIDINKSGQTYGATAGNHVITATPYYRQGV